MRKQVRVLRAKTGEHHFVPIGPSIAIRVAIKQDVAAILNERPILVRLKAEWHDKSIGEDPRFRIRSDRCTTRLVEYHDAVASASRKERVRGALIFVRVDGILERGHR